MDVRGWWLILKDHFRREFTRQEDVLPSLKGRIGIWEDCTKDEPVLGLWKKDLPLHMCWFCAFGNSVVDRLPGQPSWCWTSIPQRRKVIIVHVALDDVSPKDVVWQADVNAIDIQWEGQPFVSRVKKAAVSLSRAKATKGDFHQASHYLLDNKEEKEFQRPEAVEIFPLVITKHYGTDITDRTQLHMHALLLERVNIANGQVKYYRKGYGRFLSRFDYTLDTDARIEDVIQGMETTDTKEIL
jgi:hypothetical protein